MKPPRHRALLDADRLLDDIRQTILRTAPELLETFETYRGEAEFGRALIEGDLARLQPGAAILEVGAGSLMLSTILRQDGFEITALEPTGMGFSHVRRLQEIVLDHAQCHGIAPQLLPGRAEELTLTGQFEFAFSINVMEHVGDVAQVLQNVHRALRPGGTHRFVCPNYAFPYEPHFNIPTLFTRALTERFLWQWIAGSKTVPDPVGTWSSLNWISVRQVRHLCRGSSMAPSFSPDIFESFLDRAQSDREFQARRGVMLVGLVDLLRRSRLLRLTRLVPPAALPVMDCRIVRTA
jgi:2-polyprenyl-3-methyl-5-hydroxy-6-metoxy-1,4-benzoquinol methylase